MLRPFLVVLLPILLIFLLSLSYFFILKNYQFVNFLFLVANLLSVMIIDKVIVQSDAESGFMDFLIQNGRSKLPYYFVIFCTSQLMLAPLTILSFFYTQSAYIPILLVFIDVICFFILCGKTVLKVLMLPIFVGLLYIFMSNHSIS